LLIYQIPLKVKNTSRNQMYDECEYKTVSKKMCYKKSKKCEENERGMDNAILSKGEAHSDFIGINNKVLERDTQFPIRCTAQFYKVTDSADIPEYVFEDMNTNIKNIYTKGINQGSLVVDGFTGRSTEWVDKTK